MDFLNINKKEQLNKALQPTQNPRGGVQRYALI